MPSRTILHGKGVGSKCRNRVTTGVGCFFDEKISKIERNMITSWIRPPQGPSLVGCRHTGYIYKFQKSYVFEKNVFCRKKTKHDYLVGAGLSGTHFCWHQLCGILLGILYFACFLLNSCSSSKLKGHREHAGFGLLRDPLFLAPRMRVVYRNFTFCMLFVE